MEIGLKRFLHDLQHRRYRFRQATGGLFAVALLITAQPRPRLFAAGVVLAALGEAVRMWAAGHVRKDEELSTRGPYAFVRHPQYLGNTLLAVGLSFASGHWWAVLIWGIIFWLYYVPAIRREDKRLEYRFGEAWREWSRKTPAVIPGRRPAGGIGGDGGWSLKQAVRNGETLWALLLAGGLFAMYRWAPFV